MLMRNDAFVGMVKLCGYSVLMLAGIPPEEAKQYQFRAIVLKDKRLEPDIEAIPVLEGADKKLFLEFQGYKDIFIRYRAIGNALISCVHEGFKGKARIVIFYTDQSFKDAARPVSAFSDIIETEFSEYITEIVLNEYTLSQLLEVDPKLVILAPFTV
ncbi:MAG: hypothetical protein OMM_07791, partial [Candidatus Magnetoglobus multicellularis str. Araruama]